jgi:AP-4 complex subunit epsilon-1
LQTLKIVQKIDANILESYYTQSFGGLSSALSTKEKDELMTRLLEVIETLCVEDGELYARKLKDMLEVADPPAKGHPVSDKIVETVLLWIHNGMSVL